MHGSIANMKKYGPAVFNRSEINFDHTVNLFKMEVSAKRGPYGKRHFSRLQTVNASWPRRLTGKFRNAAEQPMITTR